MYYLYFRDDEDEYWIEIDNDNIAYRQLIKTKEGFHNSCLEDCLAEGPIVIQELPITTRRIIHNEFEEKWRESLEPYHKKWLKIKGKYKIGDEIVGVMKYQYPQGIIFKGFDDNIILYKGNMKVVLNECKRMRITDFDDTNMWIVTSDLCSFTSHS